MAKKKSSAKQSKNSLLKKSAKKAVVKAKKKTPQANSKKAVKAVKKIVKKKASIAKKSAAPKKSVTAKKTGSGKKPSKPALKSKVTSKKAAAKPRLKEAVSAKAADLSHFVTPLDDRLIVRLSGAEKMTAGGLYIPDSVSDTSGNLQGVVVAAGRGHFSKKGHLRPMDVKLGDKVVFSEYAGSKIKIQNEDLVILRESDVMGVVAK